MVKRKIKRRVVTVKLAYPSGRVTTRKLKSKFKSLPAIQKEFLGTAEHFRTEAFPIRLVKKRLKGGRR